MPTTRSALMSVRPERFCLVTDYPQEMHNGADIRAHVEGIRALDITSGDISAILGGNIAVALGL